MRQVAGLPSSLAFFPSKPGGRTQDAQGMTGPGAVKLACGGARVPELAP